MKLIEKIDGVVVLNYSEDRQYEVFKDLAGYGDTDRYLRGSTRRAIYKTIRDESPEVWNELLEEDWFQENYPELVELGKVDTGATATGTATTSATATTSTTSAPAGAQLVDGGEILQKLDAIAAGMQKQSPLEEAMIEAIIAKGSTLATEDLLEDAKEKLDEFIQKTYGILPKVVEVKTPKGSTQLSGIFHEKYQDLLTTISADIPVMLVGPAGSGKNHTLEQVAEALEIPFRYTGAVTQEHKITGFIDANGTYHETEFYKAFKDGGLFMLDEVDASSPDVLVLLNGAIANGYFDFPNGRITCHEDFRVVAAGNTYGTGADMVYVGRNVLDGATLDRFVNITMDYSPEVESQLAYDKDYYEFIVALRKAVRETNLRHIISMRMTINGTKALNAGLDEMFVIESVICKGMSKDDMMTIASEMSLDNKWTRAFDKFRKEA